jgi:hypothetical protein
MQKHINVVAAAGNRTQSQIQTPVAVLLYSIEAVKPYASRQHQVKKPYPSRMHGRTRCGLNTDPDRKGRAARLYRGIGILISRQCSGIKSL